jgi:hypothetical protein
MRPEVAPPRGRSPSRVSPWSPTRLTRRLLSSGPYTLDGTAVTVAHARPGISMERYIFTPTARLHATVPGEAPAGTSRSDVSVSVTSGP